MMNHRESPLFWSFPIGTWSRVRIRVSVFFPVVLAILCYRLGTTLGLATGGVLFFSVLLHEFGHIRAARLTGGSGHDILMWPLGGLAYVQPAPTKSSHLWTNAGGLVVNAVLCLLTAWVVWSSPHRAAAFNPFVLPNLELAGDWIKDLLVLTFACNWVLLLINLLPVYPLDGGAILHTLLVRDSHSHRGAEIYLRIGFFLAFALMIAGLFIDHTWLVAIGAVVVVLNAFEAQQMNSRDAYDESFMGYDFSQGYTSLERSTDTETEPLPKQKRSGFLKRWKERRRVARVERETREQEEAAEQLDALLDKVHVNGMDALTESERRMLTKASNRYKKQNK